MTPPPLPPQPASSPASPPAVAARPPGAGPGESTDRHALRAALAGAVQEPSVTRPALAWVAAYLVVAGLWIIGSDAWVSRTAADVESLGRLQAAKGLAFVVLTAAMMYVAVREALRQRQRQRQRLSAIEGRWAHLVSALDEVVWLASPDARRIDYVSDAAARVYGRPPAEFIEHPQLWLGVVHPEDHGRVAASQVHVGGADSGDIEYRIRHSDGDWRWVRARTWLLRDAAGRPVALGGVVEDITAQHDALQLAEARQQQLAGIVETAMDAIITIDTEQRIRVFNSAAARMLRIPAEQAIGQTLDRFIPEASRAAHRDHVRHFAQTGDTSRRMGHLQTLTGLRADGEPFPLEASIARFSHGGQTLMTVVLRDITVVQRAEAARQAQAQAEAASRAKTEFLSRMSHELRTPLNAMLGFAQILDSDPGGSLTQQQHEQLGHIQQAGWHLLRLINDVLDVSRIEAGRIDLRRDNLDLAAALDDAAQLSATLAADAGVELRLDHRQGSGPPLRAWGDATRLRQVLLNLLSNAIKYNRRGGWVRTALGGNAQVVHIDVEDNGLGISSEQMAHLFEPFNRLGRERGPAEGTGIGLVLSRELIEHMGGSLAIDSGSARGTRARIMLPRAGEPSGAPPWPQPLSPAQEPTVPAAAGAGQATPVVPAPAPPAAAAASQAPAVSAATAALAAPPVTHAVHGRVLSVEDNPVNQLLVEQLLSRLPGVELLQADSGQAALDLARRERPDLILLDLHLPDMEGAQWLDRLRADAQLAAIPVVALSASALEEDVRQALAHGACDYWTKPLDFDRFIGGITGLLGGSR
ncbi:MAG: PAS domain-containing hybrid sensor histidine kinase/response regulator [Pseudomonadota bacterium]